MARYLLTDEQGVPLSDALVAVFGAGSEAYLGRTDSRGEYAIQSRGSGVAQLLVRPIAWAPQVATVSTAPGEHTVILSRGYMVAGVLVVRSQEDPGRIHLKLRSDIPYVLEHQLRERALAMDAVSLVDNSVHTLSAPDGRFHFEGLPPEWAGELEVPETFRFAGELMDARSDRYNVLRLNRAEGGLYLELLPVLGIRGRIIEVPGGRPVARASVQARIAYAAEDRHNPIAQRAVITDGDGRFSVPALDSSIAGGMLSICTPDGATWRELPLGARELQEDWDLGEIPLHESRDQCVLGLFVHDARGTPISGAVGLLARTALRSAPTDAGGRTSLAGVLLGESIICVGAVGFSSAEVLAPLRPTGEIDVMLERACTLEVHVRTLNGDNAKRVQIVLSADGTLFDADQRGSLAALYAGASPVLSQSIGTETRAKAVSRAGRVIFNAVKPGIALHLEAHARFGGLLGRADVSPLGPEEHRVVNMSTDTWRLCGRVVDDKAQPLRGARVRIQDKALLPFLGGGSSIPTDEEGSFVIEGLAGPEVEVTATMRGYAPARFRFGQADCTSVDLALMPSERQVRVHVHPADGRPVDASVWAELRSGVRVYAVPVGSGEYSLADLPAEEILVKVTADEHTYEQSLGAGVPELDFVLPLTGAVQVMVTAPTTPGGYVFVHLLPREEENSVRSEQLTLQAGASTSMSFLGVRPGGYDAVIRRLKTLSWDGDYTWVELSPRVFLDVQADKLAQAELHGD
jgi:hypothetical protein